MAVLLFMTIGTIALFFLVRLGATQFEIEEVYIGIGYAIGYPLFSILIYLSYSILKKETGLIRVYQFSKNEETLQLVIEMASSVVGVFLLLFALDKPNRMQISMFGFLLFYVPGMIARFAVMISKAKNDKKKLIITIITFALCLVIPTIIMAVKFFAYEYSYGLLGALQYLPLFALVTIGFENTDNIPNPDKEI